MSFLDNLSVYSTSLSTISSALKSIHEIADNLKPPHKVKIQEIIDQATSELTSIREQTVSLREELLSLDKKKAEIDKQIRQFANRDNFKSMQTVSGGICFIAKTLEQGNEEPTERFCANCLNQGYARILQPHPLHVKPAKGTGKKTGHWTDNVIVQNSTQALLPEGSPNFEFICPECQSAC